MAAALLGGGTQTGALADQTIGKPKTFRPAIAGDSPGSDSVWEDQFGGAPGARHAVQVSERRRVDHASREEDRRSVRRPHGQAIAVVHDRTGEPNPVRAVRISDVQP